MKVTRLNWTLGAIVLVLGVIDLWRGSIDHAPSREIGRLLPEFFADEVARFQISGPDGEVNLKQVGEGQWVVVDRHDYPAYMVLVSTLSQALTSMTTVDLLSEDASRHGEYGLATGAIRVRAWNAEDGLIADLLRGDGVHGSRATYVRREGEDAIYRAANLPKLTTDPTKWLTGKWMPFESSIAVRVRLEFDGEEAVEFVRETSRKKWTRDGEAVRLSSMDRFLNSLPALYLQDVTAAPGTALPQTALRFEIELLGDALLSGEFSSLEGPGTVIARRTDAAGADWQVELPFAAVQNVADRARALLD